MKIGAARIRLRGFVFQKTFCVLGVVAAHESLKLGKLPNHIGKKIAFRQLRCIGCVGLRGAVGAVGVVRRQRPAAWLLSFQKL